ncbi:fructose-1,6-bisphosphatase, class II [Neorickettsia helminthoeca str. Oregon]|uniref:Fructose-1,6-bisphosphatase n=1 Tax=Neorickettsia helminthoeca str. Oregon TaxID=1286528 RepID=X5H4N7_9RICK|nr:class II fructose-bisphosphatase [Neorickettsia helminthoeca]AHX11511.1 fructose-1,6-bisphosphatase, class II [Neorickettsia helminthoeca str. Oregon]
MISDYILDFLSVTQKAAFASYSFAGRGNSKEADRIAVETMRSAINQISATVSVVIGEGERDKAPMLYIGERLGNGGLELDLAVDPLEGTDICADFREGAISVLGFGGSGSILCAPDVYMEKIYTPYECEVSFENTVAQNLKSIASAKGVESAAKLIITVLKRERNQQLIEDIRKAGAKVRLITDGDISAIVSIILKGETDAYMGSGGAPEGVLSAIAVRNLGGTMIGKLLLQDNERREYARKLGILDLEKSYTHYEMVRGEAIFIATGVTNGKLLAGIDDRDSSTIASCESLVILPGAFHKLQSSFHRSGKIQPTCLQGYPDRVSN